MLSAHSNSFEDKSNPALLSQQSAVFAAGEIVLELLGSGFCVRTNCQRKISPMNEILADEQRELLSEPASHHPKERVYFRSSQMANL